MNFFVVRLKRHPHLFCGKRNPSYAFTSDQHIAKCLKNGWDKTVDSALNVEAHWFTPEKRAKVWTNPSQLKAMFSYASESDGDGNKMACTFNEYEILMNGQVISLDELRKMK